MTSRSVSLFAILTFSLAFCGCGSAAFKGAGVSTGLSASSSTVAFGTVQVGQSASAVVKLVNSSPTAVTISKLNISGPGFTSNAQDSLPLTVAAQGSVNLGVQFSPSSAGDSSGQLAITNSAAATPLSVSLSGTGTTASTNAASAASLSSFSCASAVVTGSTTDACTITLNTPVGTDTTVALASDNGAVSVPAKVTIPAQASNAVFQATVSAVSSIQTATLTASTAGSSQTFAIQLGVVAASLDVSTTDISFGDVAVSATASQNLVLTSTGNAPVTVSTASIAGSGFSFSGVDLPLQLNPGQSTLLSVQFNSPQSGTQSGQLSLTSNSISGSTKTVRLKANAVPQVKQLSCASGSITGAGTTTCTVTLNAAAASTGQVVSLASSAAAVSIPASVTVPAGSTGISFSAAASAVTNTQTAVLTASCGGSSKSTSLQLNPSAATLSISSSSLSFGNVVVSASAAQTLTLTATGGSAVTVSSAAMTGSGFAISGAAFPLTLNPGQTASLTIQFSPTAAGTNTGQLTLSSNSSTGTSSVVSLSGSGVPALSGLSCSNGTMPSAGTDTCTVTLNTAAAAGGFQVNLASNNAAVTVSSSVTVPAGASSSTFGATVGTVTSSQTAILTASAGSFAKTFSIQIGGLVPTLSVSTSTLNFASVNVGSSATQGITLSSTGTAAVNVSAASVSGPGFTVSGATFPLTLNPGQTASISVQFSPTAAGAAAGQLNLTSNSSTGTSSTINLSGTGMPILTGFTCTNGSITGAGSDNCSVTLNTAAATGGFPVTLSSNNGAVSVPNSVSVTKGATSATFAVNISSITSAQTATLTASAGGVVQTITLQLNVGTPVLTVNSSSIAFGNVDVNNAATQSLTLTSTGTSAVTISSVVVSGAGFTVTGASMPLTLNPNQSASLSIVFDPTTAGSASGQLTITSNSSQGSTVLVSLTGTGVSHQVSLTWVAPLSSADPVAGYNVYRASNGSTAFQQLNSSPLTQTSYVDGSVLSGQTYNYYVSSVDSVGRTSSPSNIFNAVIP